MGGGHRGLAGKGSVKFCVFPVAAWAVQRLRPDLAIHVVVENAGSTIEIHRKCMRQSIGLDRGADLIPSLTGGIGRCSPESASSCPHFLGGNSGTGRHSGTMGPWVGATTAYDDAHHVTLPQPRGGTGESIQLSIRPTVFYCIGEAQSMSTYRTTCSPMQSGTTFRLRSAMAGCRWPGT
jgi:hypothetical protein